MTVSCVIIKLPTRITWQHTRKTSTKGWHILVTSVIISQLIRPICSGTSYQGPRFYCDQCDYAGVTPQQLNLHKGAKHEGQKYECNLCDYKDNYPTGLLHQQSKHSDLDSVVRYECDYEDCEFTAVRKDHMTTHKQAKHECVNYSCDQCNYRTNWQSYNMPSYVLLQFLPTVLYFFTYFTFSSCAMFNIPKLYQHTKNS